MGLDTYLNNETLNSYFINVLIKYDPDKDGFTQKEFSHALSGMTTIFAKSIIKFTRADKKIFKDIDTNKDTTVSYEEIALYIKNEYKLDFYTIMDMKVRDICTAIDNADKEKNN